jgi:hypothetical protein
MAALEELLIALALFGLLLGSVEIGFRAGRRAARTEDENGINHIGAVQGAILGMLGLLLAFSFAAAGSRFMERQDQIVQEANAIGTAYLRADLLDEPHAQELRGALRDYLAHRIAVFRGHRGGLDPAALGEVERLHARIWSAAVAGVGARPATTLAILPPVNEVLDMHTTRVASARKHLPYLVLGLLIFCSSVSLSVIGYGAGVGRRRRTLLNLSVALLIGTALWITIDLDYPRRGMIRLNDAPLQELRLP